MMMMCVCMCVYHHDLSFSSSQIRPDLHRRPYMLFLLTQKSYMEHTYTRFHLREGLVLIALKLCHDLRVCRDADQPAESLVVLQEQRGILTEDLAIRPLGRLLVALFRPHRRGIDTSTTAALVLICGGSIFGISIPACIPAFGLRPLFGGWLPSVA